jgi:hypothetical protein
MANYRWFEEFRLALEERDDIYITEIDYNRKIVTLAFSKYPVCHAWLYVQTDPIRILACNQTNCVAKHIPNAYLDITVEELLEATLKEVKKVA